MFHTERRKPAAVCRKRPDADSKLPFAEHVQLMRAKIAERRLALPEMAKRVDKLRKCAAAASGKRHLYRLGLDAQRSAAKLQRDIEFIESPEREADFDRMVAPYQRAYVRAPCLTSPRVADSSSAPCPLSHVMHNSKTRRAGIMTEYASELGVLHPNMSLSQCNSCSMCSTQMILLTSRAVMTCPICGYTTAFLDTTSSNMSYGEDMDFTSFSYKRINHLNEWLMQVQGKETTQVDDRIIEEVMDDLHRHDVHPDDVTHQRVRDSLKRLKHRKAYEHVVQITSRITGQPPPQMTPDMEETCRTMFMAVQPSFDRHCPPDRKNFLSYSYCLYKFFELLGYDDLLQSFSLLKGRDKLEKQDQIFSKICADLDWTFKKST